MSYVVESYSIYLYNCSLNLPKNCKILGVREDQFSVMVDVLTVQGTTEYELIDFIVVPRNTYFPDPHFNIVYIGFVNYSFTTYYFFVLNKDQTDG